MYIRMEVVVQEALQIQLSLDYLRETLYTEWNLSGFTIFFSKVVLLQYYNRTKVCLPNQTVYYHQQNYELWGTQLK